MTLKVIRLMKDLSNAIQRTFVRHLARFSAVPRRQLSFLLVFTARCYASAVLAMGMCLSVSACVCVCLSQVGVLLKRLNIGSHKQHHTIAQDSSFLTPKISAKFDRGHPLQGHQMQVGWVKIGDFPRITGYISKTVKIDAWFLLKSNRKSYALYRMVTLPMTLSAP